MKLNKYVAFGVLALSFLSSCSKDDDEKMAPAIVYPPVQIFQIDGDYTEYVPLGMSDNLDEILSIPAQRSEGNPAVIPLHGGWFLDKAVLFYRICYSTVRWEDYNSGAVDFKEVERSVDRAACATRWGYLPSEISDEFGASRGSSYPFGNLDIVNDYIDAGLPGFEMYE